jgi:hypothetical protein
VIPDGTRSVSVFLVNRRPPDNENPDRAYAFQAEIEVSGDQLFVPRPDPPGAFAGDWDDQVADLHYADASTSSRRSPGSDRPVRSWAVPIGSTEPVSMGPRSRAGAPVLPTHGCRPTSSSRTSCT